MKTVILADPEPGVRQLLRWRLGRAGVPVREALTPAAVYAAVSGGRAAAVVAGEWLAELDGSGLAAAVRAAAPHLPIFFFAGHSLPPEVFELPGVEVYLKPDGLGALCRELIDLAAGRTPALAR